MATGTMIRNSKVRGYQIQKTTTSGYFRIPYTEVPHGIPVIITNYRSGAANLGLIFSISNDPNDPGGYVVYVRDWNGALPSDGTVVSVFLLVLID